MRWISPAQWQAEADPRHRLAAEAQHFQQCLAQAKHEQTERHHYERQSLERERLDASRDAAETAGRAAVERERVAGENALSLTTRNHGLSQAAKSSALIDEMVLSVVRQEEEWQRTVGDTLRQLILSEADTIKQVRLRELDQRHTLEKMRLENNLKMVEMVLGHELQNLRVSYDKACDIIFRLVERALGLGPRQADTEEVREWVREAMAQTGGGTAF